MGTNLWINTDPNKTNGALTWFAGPGFEGLEGKWERVDDIVAERDALRAQLASRPAPVAVEVPEIPYEAFAEIMDTTELIAGNGAREKARRERITAWFRSELPFRLLKDGERAVPVEELEALRDLLAHARVAAHEVEDNGECDMSAICDAVDACDALRSGEAEGRVG